MKFIPLSQNKYAQVDDWRYDELNHWKWYFDGKYARRNVYRNGQFVKHILMHRFIMNDPSGVLIDHHDNDPLNNQRHNLRPANHSTNAMNMRKHRGASPYKGVCKEKTSYRVQIWQDNQKVFSVMTQNERHAA